MIVKTAPHVSLLLSAAIAGALVLGGCDADDGNSNDRDLVVVDTGRVDTTVDLPSEMSAGLVLMAMDPDWVEPSDPPTCSICQSCFTNADCFFGETCIAFDGRAVCTANCDPLDLSCPGDSRCYQVTEPTSGTSSNVCLNSGADSTMCPSSYICGPDDWMDQDAFMVDPGTTATRCNEGAVCNYCGPVLEVERECAGDNDAFACEVYRIVNDERRAMSLLPLLYNAELADAAQLHAIEMAVCHYHEHEALDGQSPTDRMRDAGYTGGLTGENIAQGQETPEQVMEAWMNSPGHRANILNPNYRELGVGYYQGGDVSNDCCRGLRWVQNFGAQ